MTPDIEFAVGVVRAILVALNGDERHWHVLDAHYQRGQAIGDEPPVGVDELAPDEERPRTVLVRIAADDRVVGAHVVVALPPQRAIAATADQLQDQVVEATQGGVFPPCPGHPHPLQAQELDGVACWVCPKHSTHHWAPIMSASRTSHTASRAERSTRVRPSGSPYAGRATASARGAGSEGRP